MWFKNRQHLSDTTLTLAYLENRDGNTVSQSTTDHLINCEDCAKKYARLTTLVHSIKLVEEPDLLTNITSERLSRQRQRIMHRIGIMVGSELPASILRFPAFFTQTTEPRFNNHRWLAVSMVAAGLFVGVIGGQLFDLPQISNLGSVPFVQDITKHILMVEPDQASQTNNPYDQIDIMTFSEIEIALEASSTTELYTLDIMTAPLYEVAINAR